MLLKTEPVDPRSLFSGDYVWLHYDISRLDLAKVDTDFDIQSPKDSDSAYEWLSSARTNLQRVWVTLQRPDNPGPWQAVSVTRKRPARTEGRVSVLGSVNRTYPQWRFTEDGALVRESSRLPVDYGIETYYVREGSGSDFEKTISNRYAETWVEVSVDSRGKAAITGIYVNGEKIEL